MGRQLNLILGQAGLPVNITWLGLGIDFGGQEEMLLLLLTIKELVNRNLQYV